MELSTTAMPQMALISYGDDNMLKEDRKIMTVPEAGRIYYGLGRSASYDAARRGELPTIRVGRKLVVPVVRMEKILIGEAGDSVNGRSSATE